MLCLTATDGGSALIAGTKQPDTMTVREAAVQIEGTPKAKERAAKESIFKIEGMARGLKISIDWEAMTEREVKRLKKALSFVVANAATLLRSAPAAQEASADTEPDQ